MVKAAQVAVALLKCLQEEARASRLSFADLMKRLADQPDNAPGFISKKVRRQRHNGTWGPRARGLSRQPAGASERNELLLLPPRVTLCVALRARSQVERVERFVVVHGQIILNQFKHWPDKAVQRSAFVGELKKRMEQRKHHKLYMSKVRQATHPLAGCGRGMSSWPPHEHRHEQPHGCADPPLGACSRARAC